MYWLLVYTLDEILPIFNVLSWSFGERGADSIEYISVMISPVRVLEAYSEIYWFCLLEAMAGDMR